jgi:hypothetical protein
MGYDDSVLLLSYPLGVASHRNAFALIGSLPLPACHVFTTRLLSLFPVSTTYHYNALSLFLVSYNRFS